MAEIKNIPVRKLWPHPDNPRKDVGDVTELAESIKANGVLQNLTKSRSKRALLDAAADLIENQQHQIDAQMYVNEGGAPSLRNGLHGE